MNKLFRTISLIAILAAAVLVLGRIGVFGSATQEVVLDVSAPVLDALSFPFRVISGAWESCTAARRLSLVNQNLRQRIADLERQLNATTDLQARSDDLEKLVKLQQEYTYEIIAARIVLKDDLSWSKTIVIDRGRRDGIVPNMAVVSGAGLVGKIIESGYAYSRVLLITDRRFRVGARLRVSRNTGIIEGEGANQLVLNYLPRDAGVVPGDEVITSGLGGLFPPGYLIGSITKTVFEEYGFYQFAMVSPAVNLNTLEYVAVVKRMPPDINLSAVDTQ